MKELPEQPQRLDTVQERIQPDFFDTIGKKELKSKYDELNRTERVKNVLNWVFILFIVIISSVAILTVAIRLMHLGLPPERQWLTVDQIQGIDKLFFSGAIGGLLVNYVKKVNGN